MRILLVEDDKDLSMTLKYELETEGYDVDVCNDGADVLLYVEQTVYDIILLDRMLPHLDGISILKEIRKKEMMVPVIMLTALGELDQKLTGLNSGADDYLVKPFAFEELAARIRCICRRPGNLMLDSTVSFADIKLNTSSYLLMGDNGSCTLSKTEGQLLEFFLKNPNQTLPRNTIISKIWGPDGAVEDGNLDNYMYFIRRRLSKISSRVSIRTIRGVGYQLEETDV